MRRRQNTRVLPTGARRRRDGSTCRASCGAFGEALAASGQAAWLHHAFTQIHPFQDGNGRVARTIATLVLLKAGLFPLIVDREDKRYIDSLEAADAGNLGPLVQFFSTIQKRYLTKAIGLAVDVRPASNVEEAVRLTSDMLVNLGRIIPKEWLEAQNSAGDLLNHALGRLNHVTGLLRDQLSTVDSTFTFVTVVLDRPPREALKTIPHNLLYDPDFNQYSKGVQLTLKTSKSASKMVIFFQGAGSSYRGILVVSGFFQEGENQPVPLSDDVFRISYEENLPELRKRFAPWMEACLVRGTALWRRTLLSVGARKRRSEGRVLKLHNRETAASGAGSWAHGLSSPPALVYKKRISTL